MSHRGLAAVLTVIAVVALTPMFAAAQSTNTTAPRTPWGAPDLQGVWTFRSITPMERPEELADKEFLTEEEAANLEQETTDKNERLLNRPARRTKVSDSVDRGEDGAPGRLQSVLVRPGYNDRRDQTHVADRGSAKWEDSAHDAGRSQAKGHDGDGSARYLDARTHPWRVGRRPGCQRVAGALHHGDQLRTADDAGCL